MKINRDNYEAYFLDYHEGLLSPAMVKEVLLFVELNPDLKTVFNDFESVTLVADQNIVFEKKSVLKKNQTSAISKVNEFNYEEFLIAETEGILDASQTALLDDFIILNPQFEKDRRLYSLSHLSSENEIVFEAKESLKKAAIPVGIIDTETFETYMARELEGDLNQDEKLQLAEFMYFNPHLEQDRKLYTQTILSVEKDIVFENKSKLKKFIMPVRKLIYYSLSAAASLALIFSIYFLLDTNNIPGEIARMNNTESKINKVSPLPAIVIPNNHVASAESKSSVRPKNYDQAASNSIKSIISNVAVTYPVEEAIASADRHIIEPLELKSAVEITSRQFVDPQFTFIRVSQMYMNQHMEFYYNLKLAEDIQYAQMNLKDKNPAKTILNSITGKTAGLFAVNRSAPIQEEKKNLSLWTFAELGVQTLNTITSSEIELNLKKDEEGKVVAYGLQGGLLDFEKEVKK